MKGDFKMNDKLSINNSFIGQLFVESILAPGNYVPSEKLLNKNGVYIQKDNIKILLIVLENAEEIAQRLIKEKDFIELIQKDYGEFKELKISVSPNSDLPKRSYCCLTESNQGTIDIVNDKANLVAVSLIDNPSLIAICCINNRIMKCFYPDAINLSSQIVRKK